MALLSLWKAIRDYLRSSAYSGGKCNLNDISSEVQISLALEGFKGAQEGWGLLQVCLPLYKPPGLVQEAWESPGLPGEWEGNSHLTTPRQAGQGALTF